MSEKLEVQIKSKMSVTDNCFCTCCHDTGKVMKVRLPETKYHNGGKLSTTYTDYWLCAPCRTKLVHALDYPENNGWSVPEFTKTDLQAERESVRE